jgi:hypothetical protein
MQASLLSEEEIGTFNDILEMRFPFGIDQCRHVRNVYGLWAAVNYFISDGKLLHSIFALTVLRRARTSQP